MDKLEEAAIKYDMDKAFMLDYYLGEYNRMKNKISDNNPYLLRLKRNIKELRKKTI
jgi:hypothetical protein